VKVSATTDSPLQTGADTVAIGVFEGKGISHDLPGEPLSALLESGEAGAERGRIAVTHAEGRRFIVLGLGARESLDPERARAVSGAAVSRARELRTRTLCWEVPHHVDDAVVGGLVEGAVLRDYRFERYKPAAAGSAAPLEELIVSAHHDIAAPVLRAATIAAAQNRARDLGNTPGNDLTPANLADYARGLAAGRSGLSVTVMDEDEIRTAGMGAFVAVSQGSVEPARLIELRYDGRGADSSAPMLAFLGKAVTFDTGGIRLKPGAKMEEMKFDMAGGAAVIEAIAALADLQAPVRVLGLVGATENMLSGSTTIEVNNPDAEGRLVLADCIVHARRLGAERLIDLATLTGGVVIALGSVYAGLMSNDDEWAAQVEASAGATGERVWRLPLHERYADMVKGRYAQLTNLTEQREASAITAAEFLHHFAGEVPWAHLDIAGTGFDVRGSYIADKGATGFGVRLLVDLAGAR
jgi:leucyl aminopeptidase